MKPNAAAAKKAMEGNISDLSDRQKEGALASLVQKLGTTTRKAEKATEKALVTGNALLKSGITLGTLTVSSMASGYLGDKLKPKGIDLRFLAGGLTMAGGVADLLTKNKYGGEYMISAGTGFLGSAMAEWGQNMGAKMAHNWTHPVPGQAAAPAVPAPAPATAGIPQPRPHLIEADEHMLTPVPMPQTPSYEYADVV